jgi:3-dehydroquinate dehydratase/shikimate dehydrogenase
VEFTDFIDKQHPSMRLGYRPGFGLGDACHAQRASALARELNCSSRPWVLRDRLEADIVINCTSLGMQPQSGETPLPADALRPGSLVLDTVYTPPDTRLLREARARGCQVISGVEVFLAQAAAQFEIWHGRSAPLAAMRNAL